MAKIKIKDIAPHKTLYRCSVTGVAWVENGSAGTGHSAHANIHQTGSVQGMKKSGYWKHNDRIERTNGFIYNVDTLVISDELDQIAADHCLCRACRERKK
jgi:hypothetical protein